VSLFQAKFDTAIWDVVSSIPYGQVMSYGQVAKAAGYPRHARMVSRAMSRSDKKLPWHRVIKSDGTLAFPADSDYYQQQKASLMSEGVVLLNGKVIPPDNDEPEDLDALIWGPDSL